MHQSRSAEFLTNLSQVRTSPKWTLRGRQVNERKTDTPGPGAYSQMSADKTKFKSTGGFGFSQAARDANRPSTAPGPGSYSPTDHRILAKKVGPQTFGTSVRQAKGVKADIPGPGSYSHPEKMGVEGPKLSFGDKRPDSRPMETPGPGAYSAYPVKSSAMEPNEPESMVPNSPKYGFGTAPREARPSSGGSPGPGAYDGRSPRLSGAPKYSMGLKRDTSRQLTRQLETPGPGAYGSPHTQFGY